jgi:hypothetical protein
LPAVGATLGGRDQTALDQLRQHPRQALFGDAQDPQQIADGDARIAPDVVQRPVMRPTQTQFGENGVGSRREVTIGEEQQVLSGANVLLAEEQQVAASLWLRVGRFEVGRWAAVRHGWHSRSLGQRR